MTMTLAKALRFCEQSKVTVDFDDEGVSIDSNSQGIHAVETTFLKAVETAMNNTVLIKIGDKVTWQPYGIECTVTGFTPIQGNVNVQFKKKRRCSWGWDDEGAISYNCLTKGWKSDD